ncbi:MAG: hypothetical protein EA427_12000 [Spirochaetaceae bacterium]|nr:MAG: hypothetical protein EA427_12000 [Spirochaetaceae bacterium]
MEQYKKTRRPAVLLWCFCAALAGVAVLAAEDGGDPTLSSVMGTLTRTGPGPIPVRAVPDMDAVPLGELQGMQHVVVVPVVASGQAYRQPEWALVHLSGARASTGEQQFGWVPLAALDSLPDSSVPVESFVSRVYPRVILYRDPAVGEESVPVFYLDLETGRETIVTRYSRESRMVTFLQESEVLITSAGTGPGSPEIIGLTDARTGRFLFGGYTWSLHDAVREDRYVRVIPVPPGRSWEETPGIREEPAPSILRGPPWSFTPEQLEEYEALRQRAGTDPALSVWVVPQVWVDTLTGETGPVGFSVQSRFEQ